MLGLVAVARQDAEADGQRGATEHDPGQVPGDVHRDSAAGAATETEHDADDSLRIARRDPRAEPAQDAAQGSVALVIGPPVERLCVGPRRIRLAVAMVEGRRKPVRRMEARALIERILELQVFGIDVERRLKLGPRRDRERNDVDLGTARRQSRHHLADRREVRIADVDDDRRARRSSRGERPQHLGDHVGAGLADADDVDRERKRLVLRHAVDAAFQRVELPFGQTLLH